VVIDHIGIAVRSLEEGIEHWKSVFGYRQITSIVVNTRQMVRVAFLAKDNSLTIKLIEPTDTQSPIYRFVRRGGGLHHLCFKCGELHGELDRLGALGLRVLVQPQPGEAFDDEEIAFLFDNPALNIELIATDKRRGLLPGEEPQS
jgi:methylmalonyl-CoA/ethylmalonyl-CoA epimerase